MTLLDPRPELIVIERRLAGHKRLDAILAATTRLPKHECDPIGWTAVNYLRAHRSWMLLWEFSTWPDTHLEPPP